MRLSGIITKVQQNREFSAIYQDYESLKDENQTLHINPTIKQINK
jgi:hypothetical protein